jgi:sugar/nucleoside kinase (ribokinase family)
MRTDDLAQATNALAGSAKVVVVKRGPDAAICQAGDKRWSLAPPAVQVVDAVGAGDSFSAGFIHQYLLGADLEDCLAYANLAGAYSCTREGGTEAFKDRRGTASFFRAHLATAGEQAASAASGHTS